MTKPKPAKPDIGLALEEWKSIAQRCEALVPQRPSALERATIHKEIDVAVTATTPIRTAVALAMGSTIVRCLAYLCHDHSIHYSDLVNKQRLRELSKPITWREYAEEGRLFEDLHTAICGARVHQAIRIATVWVHDAGFDSVMGVISIALHRLDHDNNSNLGIPKPTQEEGRNDV